MIYALIGVSNVHTGGNFFTYHSTSELSTGAIVKVEYRKSIHYGIVISVVNKPSFATKPIIDITEFVIPKIQFKLMLWMIDFYPDDLGFIVSLFMPNNIDVKSRSVLPYSILGQNAPLPIATLEQQAALDIISKQHINKILLHGDTGTGKTRVFTELIINTLDQGKSVLVLTPEIGLTPQLSADIARHINYPIINSHSQLTPAERKRIWQHAYGNTQPAIYLGPRSTLFLPINNIGLIVIDEAHDGSFNQQQSPRYNALYVASRLASLSKACLLLATATPNVSDYYMAQKTGFTILKMSEIAVSNQPAQGEIIDLTNKDNIGDNNLISIALQKALLKSQHNNEQALLFLNRRGSARLVQCSDCGWQAICLKCGIPNTYHHDNHFLICHSCGLKKTAPTNCPKCASTNLQYKNPGTKAVAELVKKMLPSKTISRFDSDSKADEKYHKNISQLKSGEINVIIGTQLIIKGIDLPKLSVVGIINADSGLNLPDFSAEEVTFQQLYQASGRVGRGHRLSKFFIQTRLPDHPVMNYALSRNWQDFYNNELTKRRLYNYPPFCFLAVAKVTKKTAKSAETNANKIYNQLASLNGVELIGPSPSFYEYVNGNHVWQIVLKSKKRSLLVKAIRTLPSNWSFWIDAQSLL